MAQAFGKPEDHNLRINRQLASDTGEFEPISSNILSLFVVTYRLKICPWQPTLIAA
jgi:hypothetical protein